MVLVEVTLNAYVLWVNREALPTVWRRLLPIVVGLLPGIVVGTLIVTRVNPSHLRFYTFVVLLPLILFQAAGFRHALKSERSIGLGFGTGLGVLYAVTTISGPPLALLLNNQGFAKREFRAGLGFIRLAESTFTAIAYAFAGLYTTNSIALVPSILPSVIIGVPIGAWLIRRLRADTFRRLCMSFDAWIVGFGISTLLRDLRWVKSSAAYLVLATVIIIDGVILYRFFKTQAQRDREQQAARDVARP
jgi:uncharacterized membrane protein YfcA